MKGIPCMPWAILLKSEQLFPPIWSPLFLIRLLCIFHMPIATHNQFAEAVFAQVRVHDRTSSAQFACFQVVACICCNDHEKHARRIGCPETKPTPNHCTSRLDRTKKNDKWGMIFHPLQSSIEFGFNPIISHPKNLTSPRG